MAESTVVTRTELPDWLRTFQEDILTRAQGLGNQQITMPEYEVAGRTPFQNQAARMAAQGVGSYMPMLQAGATTVGQGVGATQQGIRNLGQAAQMAQGAYAGALPYQQQAYNAMSQSIPTTLAAAQAGQQLSAAGREDLGAAAGQVLAAGQQGLQAATGGAQGILGASQQGQTGILGASAQGQEAARIGSQGLSQLSQQSQLTGQQSASNIQSEAARAEEARQFGLGTARSGIAGLEGASERFDPSQTGAFMNDFEGAAVQQALADIQRASDIKSQGLDAQAVQSGAFGGSRGAIQQAELDRSTLEQQGRTAAGMRQQGYESASQRAQKAYEDALGRQIQSSQTMGQLGQAGAGTSLRATQTGMQGAQQAGAMGMQGAQQAGSAAAQAGGLSAQGAQLGMQGAQMGMQAANQASNIGQGIGQLGTQYGQLGMQGAGQMGTIAGQYGAMGQGLGGLGMNQAQLGEAQQGLQSNDLNTLMQLGGQEQAQYQAQLDAARQNQYQNVMQPYQQLGFYSDIYQGMPSSQSTMQQTNAPGPSTLSQLGGLALGGYGMYRGMQ